MDEFELKELLGHSPATGNRLTPDCPDDQTLTIALDGEFRAVGRAAFEAHVSNCGYCLARLGRVARLKRDAESTEIADLTMARAQRLIQDRRSAQHAPAWAAAAAIGFAAVLTALWFAQAPELADPMTPSLPEVRNIDPEAYRPQVAFPREGAFVDSDAPLFEWSAVPGSLHYDVRIVSADGAMIWQERVQNAQWRLPEQLRLAAGQDYYFRVDAYLTRAKSLSSRHVMFRVKEDD